MLSPRKIWFYKCKIRKTENEHVKSENVKSENENEHVKSENVIIFIVFADMLRLLFFVIGDKFFRGHALGEN